MLCCNCCYYIMCGSECNVVQFSVIITFCMTYNSPNSVLKHSTKILVSLEIRFRSYNDSNHTYICITFAILLKHFESLLFCFQYTIPAEDRRDAMAIYNKFTVKELYSNVTQVSEYYLPWRIKKHAMAWNCENSCWVLLWRLLCYCE